MNNIFLLKTLIRVIQWLTVQKNVDAISCAPCSATHSEVELTSTHDVVQEGKLLQDLQGVSRGV